MLVRELVTRLGFTLDRNSLKKADEGTRILQRGATLAADAFRNLAVSVASLGGALGVRSIFQVADATQSMRARLALLPQTAGDASDAIDELARRATDARQSLNSYGTVYVRIGNAAKDYIKTQEDLFQITDTLSRALVLGGATAAEQESAFLQFSQALGAGTLQGEEFRAMAEAAPQFIDKLSESLGIPRGQLKELASEGKITTKAVIEATRGMAEYFELRFRQIPMTVGQAITIIGNRFSIMIDKINRESMFVTNTANIIISVFDAISDGIDKTQKLLGGWNNTFRISAITIGLVAIAMGALTTALKVFIAVLMRIPIFAIIAAFALLIDELWNWYQGNQTIIGDLLGTWGNFRSKIVGFFNDVAKSISAFGDLVMGIFDSAKEAVKSFWNDLLALNQSIANLFPDWMVKLMGGGSFTAEGQMAAQAAQNSGASFARSQMTQTSNVSVMLQVPMGTPEAQANFVKDVADQQIKRVLDETMRGAANNFTVAE